MFLEEYKFKGTWRKYQSDVLDDFEKYKADKKVNIVAAPGSGKTILGLEMIRRLHRHVLVLAPTITIRNQWNERFLDAYVPDGAQVDFISTDIYSLNRFNIVTYQALHYALHKKKVDEETETETEDTNMRIQTEAIEYDLIQALKKQEIKTIVLDEAHHLRTEWWKSLCEVLNSLEDTTVISLTATPPYDADRHEWEKYEEVCGSIDAEISVPELVAAGDLCPHQDYVIFNMVTQNELSDIASIEQDIEAFLALLVQNRAFIDMLESNPILKDWKKNKEFILSEPAYYGSLLIFLNAVGVPVDRRLVKLISGGTKIPAFDRYSAETLLGNVLFAHAEEYAEQKELLKDMKKQLTSLGCLEKRNVSFRDVKAVRDIMAASLGKMDSIEQIVRNEYQTLHENLSMVILADYVRKEALDSNLNDIKQLGVIPIFRRLLAKNLCEDMAVLTGTLKIIPKRVLPYVKQQLAGMGLEDDALFEEMTVDDRYLIVKGNKRVQNAIVEIVTKCLNANMIQIVIGTVSLLGEGWDAPAVNSLILASYVGSFMLSNQMRGRAIRTSIDSNKTANIWHLASLAILPGGRMDFSELATLERRMRGFVGIAYYDDVIQDGMERISIISEEALQEDYAAVNDEMFALAVKREWMASRWKKILDLYGGRNIKMVNKLAGNFKPYNKVFAVMNFEKTLWTLFFAETLQLALLCYLNINLSISATIMSNVCVDLAAISYFLVRGIRQINPIFKMRDIGQAVLTSMIKNGNILTDEQSLSIETEQIERDGKSYQKIYLKGASVHENHLFIRCMKEIFNRVKDSRYIICVKQKGLFSEDTYFNVPGIFATDKKSANLFLEQWTSCVSRAKLIYTRSQEGRQILLDARKNSMTYSKDFLKNTLDNLTEDIWVRKEASKWE